MALDKFDPESFLQDWTEEKYSPLHNTKSLAQCLREAFSIPAADSYVYRAQAETTLDVTQRAIAAKRAHGLHGWYHDDEGKPVCSFRLVANSRHAGIQTSYNTSKTERSEIYTTGIPARTLIISKIMRKCHLHTYISSNNQPDRASVSLVGRSDCLHCYL